MSHHTALLLAGFNGIAYFFSSMVPIWTIERYVDPWWSPDIMLIFSSLGRRKLMMFAVIGQGCCMAVLAGTIWDGGHAAGLVATVMLFLFNFFFATGLLAIPWLCEYSSIYHCVLNELGTNQTRTLSARGIFTTCNSNQISRYGDCNKLYVLRLFD